MFERIDSLFKPKKYLQEQFPILRDDWEDKQAEAYKKVIGKKVLIGVVGCYHEVKVLDVIKHAVKFKWDDNTEVWKFVGLFDIIKILD